MPDSVCPPPSLRRDNWQQQLNELVSAEAYNEGGGINLVNGRAGRSASARQQRHAGIQRTGLGSPDASVWRTAAA